MIYLVYKMHLSEKSRRNMKEFWNWLENREKWFYKELPMVKGVHWYYSVIGDSYTTRLVTDPPVEIGIERGLSNAR
jgi:hypothetical protein